ncbi:hypothetical protein SVAN01_00023 [Stagonosporopsis vannaccii]|nr:hypothetical protein SVAN01_00023 [Stagonosporopsis vannaccii]
MESATSPTLQDPDTLNFIYACSLCGVTFADTYKGHVETVQGLSDGINPNDRLVTKLYLSGCSHVFCGKHIEGGAPPFHPVGQKPKAPCPYCVKQVGDATVRDLYSIRGFHKDEYDPDIPPIWFRAPPMSLDGPSKEIEALRFQYLALARYCRTSYRTWKPLADALRKTEENLAAVQHRATEEHSKVVSLQHHNKSLRAAAHQVGKVDALRAEVQRLQHLEQEKDQFHADVEAFRSLKVDVRELDVFRKNKITIMRSLKLLNTMIDQNTKMKERLSSLGFAMALEPVPNFTQLTSDEFNELEGISEAYAEDEKHSQNTFSIPAAVRSAHTSTNPFTSHDRPLKRQRVDSPLPPGIQIEAPSSRDMMPPPPPKPMSKMHSVRRFFPIVRKKMSSSRSSSKEVQNHDGDVQMYDNTHWQDAIISRVSNEQSSPHQDMRSEPPDIPSTLQPEDLPQRSLIPASIGTDSDGSMFSFCASPSVNMNSVRNGDQHVKLPTAPSYLNLMDNFARDNRIELGLRDPRQSTSNQGEAQEAFRPNASIPQTRIQTQEGSNQQLWRLGHAFLHQSPNGASSPTNSQQHTSPVRKYNGFFNRAQYNSTIGSRSPDRAHLQQPTQHVQDVVSPFFGRSHYDAPLPPQPRITETQTSTHRFAASPSRGHPASRDIAACHESGCLNGLSFMDSPFDSHNEPVYKQYPLHVTTQSYRNLDTLSSQSALHEPFFLGNRKYKSWSQPRSALSRQQHTPFHSNPPPPLSLSRISLAGIGRLAPDMPTAVLAHSLERNRMQWDTLQQAGVRSSRQVYSRRPVGSSRSSSANPFARIKRGSVR